jgi:hypothetical protein
MRAEIRALFAVTWLAVGLLFIVYDAYALAAMSAAVCLLFAYLEDDA